MRQATTCCNAELRALPRDRGNARGFGMHAATDKQPDSRLGRGFALGDLRVDPQAGEVVGPGGREQLDPKVMGVLVMLAEHAGHVVSRDDLQARLWPNLVVTGDALSRCLYELRRQLSSASGGEDARVIV